MLLYKKLLLMTFGATLVCMYACIYVKKGEGNVERVLMVNSHETNLLETQTQNENTQRDLKE